MAKLSAAEIATLAREQLLVRLKKKNKQLLAQRKKPIQPPPAAAGVRNVTELALAGMGLAEIDELGYFTELRRQRCRQAFFVFILWVPALVHALVTLAG